MVVAFAAAFLAGQATTVVLLAKTLFSAGASNTQQQQTATATAVFTIFQPILIFFLTNYHIPNVTFLFYFFIYQGRILNKTKSSSTDTNSSSSGGNNTNGKLSKKQQKAAAAAAKTIISHPEPVQFRAAELEQFSAAFPHHHQPHPYSAYSSSGNSSAHPSQSLSSITSTSTSSSPGHKSLANCVRVLPGLGGPDEAWNGSAGGHGSRPGSLLVNSTSSPGSLGAPVNNGSGYPADYREVSYNNNGYGGGADSYPSMASQGGGGGGDQNTVNRRTAGAGNGGKSGGSYPGQVARNSNSSNEDASEGSRKVSLLSPKSCFKMLSFILFAHF